MSDFDDYVRARGGALLRFAYLLTGDRHLAQDLVQEALIRCHPKWRRIHRDGRQDAYVRKAITRQYLSWRRRRSFAEKATADVGIHIGHHPDGSGRILDQQTMWGLLAGLPRMQRAVIVLRFYEDQPDDVIAELLGISASTVRVHTSRGLAKLRVSPELEPTDRGDGSHR